MLGKKGGKKNMRQKIMQKKIFSCIIIKKIVHFARGFTMTLCVNILKNNLL